MEIKKRIEELKNNHTGLTPLSYTHLNWIYYNKSMKLLKIIVISLLLHLVDLLIEPHL